MRLALGLGLTMTRSAGAAAFTPAALFTGIDGAWYDPSDLSSMWQNTAGTTPAAVGSVVGKILDKSGNGYHLLKDASLAAPVLRQDASSNYYLDFTGAEGMTLAYGGSGLAASSTWVAAANAASAANKYLAALIDTSDNAPLMAYLKTSAAGGQQAAFLLNDAGSAVVNNQAAIATTWDGTNVVVSATDSGSLISWYRNGVADSTKSYTRSGTFTPPKLTFGWGANTWVGRIYGLVICQGVLSGTNRGKLETYVGAKAGLTV